MKKNYYEKSNQFVNNFKKPSFKKISRKANNSDLIKELLALKFLQIDENVFVKLNVQITFSVKSIRIESFMKNIDYEDNVNFIEYSFKDYFLNINNQQYFHKDFLKTL